MRNNHRFFFSLLAFLMVANFALAQNAQYDTARQAPQSEVGAQETGEKVITPLEGTPEMADRMRADGKIYVVVAMILVILAGFIFYLVLLDRKVRRLESLLGQKKP
jgi:hypothetical protein